MIRPMQEADIPSVLQIQQLSFDPELMESAANFYARFARFGTFFRVAGGEEGIAAYALCFPWRVGEIPAHNQPFAETLPEADCLYLHDISIHPDSRGAGLSRVMLADIYEQAVQHGFASVCLVAVAQSGTYWDRLGFHPVAGQTEKLHAYIEANYGLGARLMIRACQADL